MSVSRRADGRWLVKYKEGQYWKQKSFKNEQEARQWEADYLRQSVDTDNRLTLGELAIKFFAARPDFHPQTKQKIVNFLAEGPGSFIRDKYADSLNRQDLERMRAGVRARGSGNNTINKYQAYIRAMLAWGVDQDLISFNPWRDYKRLKVVKPIIQPSLADFWKLYRELPPWLKWAMKAAFYLALRPGQVELFGLLWTAFNWQRRIAVIRQGKSGRIKNVALNPSFMAEAWLRYQSDMANGYPYVVHRGNGQRVLSFRTAWGNACKRAGVDMRPYDIRHLAATQMLASGSDLAAVAAQLGHSNVATTGATYAHITQGSQAIAAASMPEIKDE